MSDRGSALSGLGPNISEISPARASSVDYVPYYDCAVVVVV